LIKGQSAEVLKPRRSFHALNLIEACRVACSKVPCPIHQQQPQIAVVVSTLVIAALFNLLRRRIQYFIDRRFYRRKYDARKTLDAISAKLRNDTDLAALSDDLVGW
jgi:hypothetical protein